MVTAKHAGSEQGYMQRWREGVSRCSDQFTQDWERADFVE